MIRTTFTLTALLAIALVLAPLPAVAETGATHATAAPFSVELIGADADTWMETVTGPAPSFGACDLDSCIQWCDDERVRCFFSGTSFATCMQLYNYCLDDCYWYCS